MRLPADHALVQVEVERVYRADSRRVLATLIRLLGDFDLAEEALHDAFAAAVDQWPRDGIPASPRAWLVSAGRFKAIDRVRRRARFDNAQEALVQHLQLQLEQPEADDSRSVDDDHLRLIFICCHPALSRDAQVALTLREVCGLSTEEIASAYLSKPATLAQRIVRAKSKIRSAQIPYEIPAPAELSKRLGAVLQVIYLVFNEGYSASAGHRLMRHDLCGEAIRLGREVYQLLPEPEVGGLLALMLLHQARGAARADAQGELVRLEQQDRTQWDRAQIAEGGALVEASFRSGRLGPYAVQAAIAALHAESVSFEATDWHEIVALYEVLMRLTPSPVVALNRSVALAMRDGPECGLAQLDQILAGGELGDYHLAHAARADLLTRLGRNDDARAAYTQALALVQQEPERRFLQRQLAALDAESMVRH